MCMLWGKRYTCTQCLIGRMVAAIVTQRATKEGCNCDSVNNHNTSILHRSLEDVAMWMVMGTMRDRGTNGCSAERWWELCGEFVCAWGVLNAIKREKQKTTTKIHYQTHGSAPRPRLRTVSRLVWSKPNHDNNRAQIEINFDMDCCYFLLVQTFLLSL